MKKLVFSPNIPGLRVPRSGHRLPWSVASLAALSLIAVQSVQADTLSATAPASAIWGTDSNWFDGSHPVSTDDVLLDYSSNPSVTTLLGLNAAQAANSLTFSSAAGPLGAFALQANTTGTTAQTLTLTTGNVTFDSSLTGAVSIGTANGVLTLATPSVSTGFTFTNNSTQSINLTAAISNDGVSSVTPVTVTYQGSGVFDIGSVGNLYGTGAANGTATTLLKSGTIRATVSSILGTSSSNILGAAGALNFPAGSTGVFQVGGQTVSLQGVTGTNVGVIENASATAGTLLLVQGSANSNFSGVIRDGTGGGQLNLLKGTGGNALQLTGANTFTGTVTAESVIQVTTLNSVSTNASLGTTHSASSSLGAPTTVANGTISLGIQNAVTTAGGTLIYVGTGETTDRVINLANTTTGSVVTESGTSGTVKFLNVATSTIAAKSLTLSGSTNGVGQIAGAIPDNTATATLTPSTFAASATTITVPLANDTFPAGVTAVGVGSTISGTGIAAGTTITAYNTGSGMYTLSQATTAAGGGASNQVTFSGGATSLTKSGTGTWGLTNASGSTYSGPTLISAGTLMINNTSGSATGTGAVSLGTAAGTLATLSSGPGTTGIITGNVTALNTASSKIVPGGAGSVGLLTLTTLTAANGATFAYDLGATSGGTSTDHITLNTLNSTGTAAGGLAFSFTGAGTAGTTYDLVDYMTGTALTLSQLSATGANGSFALDPNATTGGFEIDFTVTPVPEPSTWIAGLLALASVAWAQRRRIIGTAAGC